MRRPTGRRLLAALALLTLSACTAPSERVVETPGSGAIAGQSGDAIASPVGRPYLQVANAANAETTSSFGPMAGSFALDDGSIVYRHVAPAASAVAAGPVTDLRLSYFKVGTDGTVQDWATGSVPAGQSACPFYVSGSCRHCTDFAARQQTFDTFDPVVRTAGGAPLTGWGSRRTNPVAASPAVAMPSPATSSLPLYPGANPDADAAYTN